MIDGGEWELNILNDVPKTAFSLTTKQALRKVTFMQETTIWWLSPPLLPYRNRTSLLQKHQAGGTKIPQQSYSGRCQPNWSTDAAHRLPSGCRCWWPFSPSWCHWSRSSYWFWQSAGVSAKWLATSVFAAFRSTRVTAYKGAGTFASNMGGLCWFTNKLVILLAVCFVEINNVFLVVYFCGTPFTAWPSHETLIFMTCPFSICTIWWSVRVNKKLCETLRMICRQQGAILKYNAMRNPKKGILSPAQARNPTDTQPQRYFAEVVPRHVVDQSPLWELPTMVA